MTIKYRPGMVRDDRDGEWVHGAQLARAKERIKALEKELVVLKKAGTEDGVVCEACERTYQERIKALKKMIINARSDFQLWDCPKCERLCHPGHVCYGCGYDPSAPEDWDGKED